VTDIYKLNNPLGVCGKNLPCLVIGLTISLMFGCTKDGTGGVYAICGITGISGITGIGCIGSGTTGMFGKPGIFEKSGMFAKIFCGNVCAGIAGSFIG